MLAYSLEARIIQKKDQLEELSTARAVISTPIVEEVRTGQQFLIKLHLVRNGSTHIPMFPSLRVGRREAINVVGEARAEPEPLTLEIAVHLAKSGQIRKGACAKCCHKVKKRKKKKGGWLHWLHFFITCGNFQERRRVQRHLFFMHELGNLVGMCMSIQLC